MLFNMLLKYLLCVITVQANMNEFIIQKGEFNYFKVSDCINLNLSTCFANHPLSPYGLIYLPKSVNETPYPGCSNECPFCNFICHPDNGMSPIWRLGNNEAIIVNVKNIPKMKYSTFTMYLWGRYHRYIRFHLETPYYLQCKNENKYCNHFASLGDSISIHTPTKLIITASNSVYVKLFESLNDPNIKLMALPGTILKLGVDTTTKDLFSFVHRIAFADNQSETNQYIQNPTIEILRVTTKHPIKNNILFNRMELKKRKIGKKESTPEYNHTELINALTTLKKSIIKQYGYHYTKSDMNAELFDSGYDCIDNYYECNGDVRDTLYTIPKSFLKNDYMCSYINVLNVELLYTILLIIVAYYLFNIRYYYVFLILLFCFYIVYPAKMYPCKYSSILQTKPYKDDFFLMIGVNHKETEYCLYHSISVYKKNKRIGMNVITDDLFYNSSFEYSPILSKYLYAYKFKYDCENELYCSEIGSDKVFFIERMYAHPKTGIGAHRSEIINSTLFHFVLPN